MNQNELSEKIRLALDRMSGGARTVAEFVLERPQDVAMLPAARVASQLDISESTVTRFAVFLGYDGYPAFRRDLQSTIRRSLEPLQRLAFAGAGPGEAPEQPYSGAFKQEIADILRTEQQISSAQMDAALDVMLKARTIYVAGFRASYGLAHMFHFHLGQMLENVHLLDGGQGSPLDGMRHIGKRDVLVCMSFPRHARLAVQAVGLAHARGASIISMTDGPLSPIAGKASVLLPVSTSVLNMATSLIGGYALINALCSAIPARARARVAANLEQIEESLRLSGFHHTS